MAFLSNFEGGEPPLGHIHLPPNFTGLLDTPFGNFLEIFLKIHDIDLILRHPTIEAHLVRVRRLFVFQQDSIPL